MARPLDPGELHALYVELAPAVFRRARALLGEDAEAWDVVQEVFGKLVESPAAFRREAQPMTFLYRATTNHCLNLLRARKVRAVTLENGDPAYQPVQPDARELLAALWNALSRRGLEIATLHFFDGMTQDEIAPVVGLSRKTVGKELQKIRALAEQLAGKGGTR